MPPTRTAQTTKCDLTVQRAKSKSLFSDINKYRRSKNLPSLNWDDQLFTYCVLHNIDMHASRIKSSRFDIGQKYNENTCCSAKSGDIFDVWRTRDQEKQNLLFNGVEYSAVAIYGDSHECYATQIFTARKPRGSAPSMKSHKTCNTCRAGKSSSKKKSSSSATRATSVASTRITSSGRRHSTRSTSRAKVGLKRSASVPATRASSSPRTNLTRRASSMARTRETRRVFSSARTRETRRASSTPRSGATRTSSVPRASSFSKKRSVMRGIGQSIRQSLRLGLRNFGSSLTQHDAKSCLQCRSRSRRRSGASSPMRIPNCCDCPFSAGPSRRFPGPDFPRMPGGRCPSFSSDDSFDCTICNRRRTWDFCDTCSLREC